MTVEQARALHQARLEQNIILYMYIERWNDDPSSAPFDITWEQPYANIREKNGKIIGQFVQKEKNYMLHWLRSYADLMVLDSASKVHKETV